MLVYPQSERKVTSIGTGVLIDPASGSRIAGAERRRDCYAMAY